MKLYPNITAIFCIWALSVFVIFYLGFLNIPTQNPQSSDFFNRLGNWDGGHYLSIAKDGYTEAFQYAFFPLYPILIRFLNQIFQNYLLSAILISIGSSFLAFHLLYKAVAVDFEKKIAEKVILFLLLFPTSFYFLTAYSEGLFFLLTVSTFYFLQRKNLLLAVIFASLASATRISGMAVVLALLIDIKLNTGFNKKNWFVLFAPLGFILYCWFLFSQTGDPFYFLTAENHWQRYLTVPGVSFWEAIKSAAHFNISVDLLFAILGLGLILRSFRFLPAVYSFYGLLSLLFPLLTPTLTSMPRFLVVLFPIFILIALIKNKYIIIAYQIISLLLLSLFATLFINGYWVS